jgi:hypothetical protein
MDDGGEGDGMLDLARGSSIEGGGHVALLALGFAVICFILAAIVKRRR